MPDVPPKLPRTYPRAIHLREGTVMSVRLMTPADAHHIVTFARSLPEDDLLFLRTDITDPEMVGQWMQNLEAGDPVRSSARSTARWPATRPSSRTA